MDVPGDTALRTPLGLRQRVASVTCGCALAAGAALVAFNDPSAPGSLFPGCAFRQVTGLWCPGCGLTRGTHYLLTGDPVAALGSNVFTPFVLGVIVLVWVVWTAKSFGRSISDPIAKLPNWTTPVLLVVVVAYGVARNMPVASLRALAP